MQIEEFLDDVRGGLLDAAASAGTLHGWRVQSLFRGVVVALDSVRWIKDEDVGDALHGPPEIAVPDFRVVTDSGDQLLIEVKNESQKTPTSNYSMRTKDLDGLQAYSDLVKTPLRVALYWWKWNLWSLVDPGALTADGAKYRITLPEAMMANEMSRLGDRSLGTEYPLQFRLTADPTVSREEDLNSRQMSSMGGTRRTVLLRSERELSCRRGTGRQAFSSLWWEPSCALPTLLSRDQAQPTL